MEAPLIIQLHVASALPAILIGPFAIFMKTSWRLHKIVGFSWIVAMASLCITGLLIPSYNLAVIGHLGPIHLFCFWGLSGIFNGVRYARLGRIAEHRMTLKWTWFGAMGAASLANFLPGRTINRMFFETTPDTGWIVIGVGLAVLVFAWQHDRGQVMKFA
jgi:uncharacterized membrane protein